MQGEGSRPPGPTRDHGLPLVTDLPAKPALSSKRLSSACLRTSDCVLGTVPGAWDTATHRTEVPDHGPDVTPRRGGTHSKQ